MSIKDSNLAQSQYGYDTVVAVSQKALNNTIKTFYSNIASTKPFTQQVCYFVLDTANNPQLIDKATLLSTVTSGIDPFTVKSSTDANFGKVTANNHFYCAFSFTPGDPTGINNFTYLTINPGTQSVQYYLLCTGIQVVLWESHSGTWINATQSRANEFNINATLKLQNVLDNTNLPPAVQAQVNNLGATSVDVQQLLFDFDSAVINPTATIPGYQATNTNFQPLLQQFAARYFAAYAAVEIPRLNYAITQQNSASLVPTSMEFYAGALVDSTGKPIPASTDNAVADLSTINYIFSVNGDPLAAPAQLNWNWLDDNGTNPSPDMDPAADVNQHNGAISVNRDTFAKYLATQLNKYVLGNCLVPVISTGSSLYQNEFDVSFVQSKPSPLASGFQSFDWANVQVDLSDTLLSYLFNQSGTAKGWQKEDFLTWTNHFDMMVYVTSTQLTITQSLTIYIDTVWSGNAPGCAVNGIPVNKVYKDVFDIVIDNSGTINLVNTSSTVTDNSKALDPAPPANIVGSLNSLISMLSNSNFTQVPVTMPKQFVFPGGDAFTFQDAQFSKYSDLVCHVTYKSQS